MQSFKIKRRLDENGIYKIPNDIIFRDSSDTQLLKYNLELNIGNDMKLISAILSYISNKHYKFLSTKKTEIYFFIHNSLYINTDGLKTPLVIYSIDNFYLKDDILYISNSEDELLLLKRRIKIEKILDHKKNVLPL